MTVSELDLSRKIHIVLSLFKAIYNAFGNPKNCKNVPLFDLKF